MIQTIISLIACTRIVHSEVYLKSRICQPSVQVQPTIIMNMMAKGPTQGPNVAVSRIHGLVPQLAFLLGVLYSLSIIHAQDVHSICENLLPSPNLTPFVEPLTIPTVIDVSTGYQTTLGAYKISQSVHPDLPNTTFYGYGTSQETATSPGPTLEATQGVSSLVRFENHITDPEHIFVVDRTIHRAEPPQGGVPIITHLHGADTEGKYDGHSEAWYTASGDTGPTFVTRDNVYPNEQPASLLWYHDHTLGYTRLNVAAGLAGLYIIRGGEEPADLPKDEFEIPLVLQDKQFFPNGSINFPDTGTPLAASHPNWCPDYFGDTILVNGKAWPYLNVTRNIYRFRILNGANARVFTLSFSDSRVKFLQIGTDGGYLWTPMSLESITIAAAYRIDALVDFREIPEGTVLYLNNSAPAPFPNGNPINSPPSTTYVMKFNVVNAYPGSAAQNVVLPTSIGTAPDIDSITSNATYRSINMQVILPPDLRFSLGGHNWSEPATETPQLYTTEVWDIVHLIQGGIHPIHVHLVNFLVVHEQAFNRTRLNAGECTLQQPYPEPDSCFTQDPQPPRETQIGWKDTVLVYPQTVLRFVLQFSPRSGGTYSFDPTTFPGYVWHCHNLDHEDHDMMRPLQVLPPP